MTKQGFKQKIVTELKKFFVYTLFFTFFFGLFGTYKRLILGEYAISYIHYGYGLIEAIILSKVILLGQTFGLGEKRFSDQPMIYPVIYKTILFTLFAFLFAILEHFILGYFKGIKYATLYRDLMTRNLDQILATMLVMSFVFLLFFSLFEITQKIGTKKMYDLFFKKNSGY